MKKNVRAQILIVDDNLENLKLLGQLLSQENFSVVIAQSGKQALDYLYSSLDALPDLILLDIMMPDMDGLEVMNKIRQNDKIKTLPVIFLSAKTDTEDIVAGFKAGAVDYISKPFQKAELLARVKTHVELKQSRDELTLLRGTLPICANCKSIRNDTGYWEQVDEYFQKHSDLLFSHGLCPDCAQKLYGDQKWFNKSKKNSEKE